MNKISIISPSMKGGGAEKIALNLSNYYVNNGHEVDLVLFRKRGPYLELLDKNINVIDLMAEGNIKPLLFLRKYIKQNPQNYYLSSVRKSNITLGISSLGIKLRRIVFREANTYDSILKENFLKRTITLLLMRFAYNKADLIIANSNDTKNDVIKYLSTSQKVSVIPNPVLPNNYNELKYESITEPWLNNPSLSVIISVGRLQEQKNFHYLIDVFNDVYRFNKSSRLIIIGDGGLYESLSRCIEERCLSGVVKILPFQNNVFPYFLHAKIFALTSKWEGFGNVLVEALSTGTHVVSNDCPGGPRTILDNGKYGDLIPVGDKAAFVTAVLNGLNHKEKNIFLEKRAQEYSVKKIAGSYLSAILYKE